jgi:hypothetical protein
MTPGYGAERTRAMLMGMDSALNAEKGSAPEAGGAADEAVDGSMRPRG